MQPLPCKFLRFYSSAVAACVTKCLFCHIRLRLCSAADGECRYPQRQRQGFCGWAVRSAPTAARRFGGTVPPPFVAPHHSAHSTPVAAFVDGLTKRAFCNRKPLFFAAVAAVGRSLRSLRAACGGTFKPPTAAELCRPHLAAVWLAVPPRAVSVRNNRPSLRVVVQKAHQQVHIIVSRTCHCDSKAAEHGRYCKFCDTVSQRISCVRSAVLSAHNAVF